MTRRRLILDQISDPLLRLVVIMQWLERRVIWGDEAEQLMRDNGLVHV